MWTWIKQMFCSHEFRLKVLVGTRYDSDRNVYRVYKTKCVKCGKVIYEEVLL